MKDVREVLKKYCEKGITSSTYIAGKRGDESGRVAKRGGAD